MATTMPAGQDPAQAYQENMAIRQHVVANSIDWTNRIFSRTITDYVPGSAYQVNVPLQNVGLVKRLWVYVTGTFADAAAGTGATLTTLGPSNLFSNITFIDTSNTTRHNTTGWHMHNVASARRRSVFGAAYATSDPAGTGANNGIMRAVDIPAGGTDGGLFSWLLEIPVSYSDTDLTGALWMGVINATASLQLTINPFVFAAAAATDATGSVYQANAGGSINTAPITSLTIRVYQNALDQIPKDGAGNFLLPRIDLQNAFILQSTNTSGFTANLDQAIPYANFRQFHSTFVLYDNGGTLNPGTDINYFALQSANMTNFFWVEPGVLDLMTRNILGDDFPTGLHYIDTRNQPIDTLQYGNRQLIINPSTVNAGANFQVGYEAIAPLGVTTQAGSLYQS